jgi:epoxyqueuosine reductase
MKVLLHICCGVCAAGAADVLISEGHEVTGFFYNPNIFPDSEYLARLATTRKTATQLGFNLIEGNYDPRAWLSQALSLKSESEGGKRCSVCYRMRMQRSFRTMLEMGLDAFTSTLTISPHKSARIINAIGEEIGGSRFLPRDFKKKDGFKKAVELAKRWDLYRQDYCGCIYSMERKHR